MHTQSDPQVSDTRLPLLPAPTLVSESIDAVPCLPKVRTARVLLPVAAAYVIAGDVKGSQARALSAKHFLNDPDTLVLDSLRGLCALNPQLALDVKDKGKHTD